MQDVTKKFINKLALTDDRKKHVRIYFNALYEHCSIFDDVDSDVAKLLTNRLDQGDHAAWFCAEIKVCIGLFNSSTYLGCCSYNTFDEFLEDGYALDMVTEALDLCIDNINISTSMVELFNQGTKHG